MISRIDHVSIAVRDYEKAFAFFSSVLGALPGAASVDRGSKYFWHTLSLGDLSRIELLTPTGKEGLLDRFLAEREGVHHLCLQTSDIKAARKALDQHGIPYFGYYEYAGGDWKELFIHPRDAFGVLIQIAEFTSDDFISDALKLPAHRKWTVKKSSEGVKLTLAHPGGGTVRVDLTPAEAKALIEDLGRML